MVTHPFHPLRGRNLRVYDRVDGSRRAIIRHFVGGPDCPTLASVPIAWTSLRHVDEFERVSAGRCLFRAGDLAALCEAVDLLRSQATRRNQK